MATVAAYTSPALGNLSPMIGLLCELQRRGHHIVLRTFADGAPNGRELGFDCSAIDQRIEDLVMTDWMAPNGREALKAAFGVFGRRAVHEVDDLNGMIADSRPDVLIVDANCWGAATAAEISGIPWATLWPYPPFLRSRGLPPFGPGLKPWRGPAGRLRDGLLRPFVTGALEDAMLPALNEIRQGVGAPSVRNAGDFIRRAPLILVATAKPLEYLVTDWGPAVELIGPCEVEAPTSVPDWLAEIDGPLVLVTTSSDPQNDGNLPVCAMAALANEPVHVVATYPSGIPSDIAASANATVARFAPHGQVLDRAVCAITHGGMGVTQKALARGVPVCVVPYGRDQFEVARRVQVARCGTRLPARRLSADRLRTAVRRAMSMSEGARRVAAGFRDCGGVGHGAGVIEQRLLNL